MSRRHPSRLVMSLAVACAVGTLAGCGGSAVDPGSGALGSTEDPTPTTAATPGSTPTKSTKPRPTPTSDDGGDGDADGDDAPATAGGGVCADISADEVGDVLGVLVSGSGIPTGGCEFRQAGKRGTQVTIVDKSSAAAGGLDGAKAEATSAVEGEPENVSGIGSGAFVVTGTIFGGGDIQGAGAVQVGGRIISAFVVQRSGMSASRVRTLELSLLKLIVREKA